MEGNLQTPVLKNAIKRYPFIELFYIQDMNGDQTSRSSGTLSNRKNRWWFSRIEKNPKPFISESYYSVSTNMPCTSVFFPIYNEDNQLQGIFGSDIMLEELQNIVF